MLFLQEINLMKRVSSVGSRHVIQLIGCIVSETPMAMVMEYAPFGDLHGNLIKWREEVSGLILCNSISTLNMININHHCIFSTSLL